MFQNTIALKLNEEEFGCFLRKYKKDKSIDKVTETHADFKFERCEASGAFLMHEIIPAEAVFMTFAPFGKSAKALDEEKLFVVPAKRQMRTLADTFNGLYRSYSDLEREMRKNLGEWMPADFDWPEHIGIIDGGSGIRIKKLSQKQRRSIIREQLKRDPKLSDRQIAAKIGVSHTTVTSVRLESELRGDIPSVTHVYDTLGRRQPRDRIIINGNMREPAIAKEVAWCTEQTV